MKKFILACLFSCLTIISLAKNTPTPVDRVDPPNWWVGMKTNTVELLFSGKNLATAEITLNTPFSRIIKIENAKNSYYKYITVEIGELQTAGTLDFEILLKGAKKKFIYKYPLLKRTGKQPLGINGADNMYLLFPDRFANGDTSNDTLSYMHEGVNRKELKERHGGDIKGIMNHINYLENLGVTALWINPLVENNQTKESYHGYACTDSYKIDPRFGTNQMFVALADSCRKHGIKMVWDIVYNHWGIEHHLYKNLPDSSWINWAPTFTRTTYRAETLMDPYSTPEERKAMSDGWFDNHMPDLNQRDPHMAKYLIQNAIWWTELAGLDAFRIDTYSYPDQQFMRDCNVAIKKEYPNINIFGETWVNTSPVQAWFTEDNGLNKSFSSKLDGVTDFQLYFAISKGLMEPFGWEEGFRRIELTLVADIIYEDAYRNVTFLDNHDLGRFYSIVNEDFDKWKMGMVMIHTLRGVPCTYYGNEILMKNYANPDALVREDFPGGWPGDPIDKFNYANLGGKQKEAFDLSKSIFNWRKQNPWIANAKLTQYVPTENTWVYFRTEGDQTLMCIYSLNDKPVDLDLKRFAPTLNGKTRGMDVLSGERIFLDGKITIPAKGSLMLHLKN